FHDEFTSSFTYYDSLVHGRVVDVTKSKHDGPSLMAQSGFEICLIRLCLFHRIIGCVRFHPCSSLLSSSMMIHHHVHPKTSPSNAPATFSLALFNRKSKSTKRSLKWSAKLLGKRAFPDTEKFQNRFGKTKRSFSEVTTSKSIV